MIAIIQSFPVYPPKNGGTKSNFLFSKELNQQTQMASLSTTNNDVENAPFKIYPLFEDKKSKYLLPQIGKKVIDKCVEIGADTILMNHPYMAPITFTRAKKKGMKIVLYAHNIEYQRFRSMGKAFWPALYLMEKWAMNYADYVLFVSEEDKVEANKHFGLENTTLLSAPVPLAQEQNPPERADNRTKIRTQLQLGENTKLLYYYGPMDYLPNREALKMLLTEIIPILDQHNEDYLLALSGKNLDAEMEQIIEKHPKVKWLGFVDDFEAQVQATDLMLNPIWLGGGVKVKLMEALANGVTSISFHSGSLGIDASTAKGKLHIVPDKDATAFAEKIISLQKEDFSMPTPDEYYNRYAGKNVVRRVLEALGKV